MAKEKGSLRDTAIGRFFVKPKDGEDVAEAPRGAPPTEPVAAPSILSATSSVSVSSTLVEEITRRLSEKVAAGTASALTTFLDQLELLKDLGLPEETLYKKALQFAMKSGATAEDIIQAAEARLKILPREREQFEEDCHAAETDQIGAKRAQIADIDRQIGQLEVQLSTLRDQRSRLDGEVSVVTRQLAEQRAGFETSYRNVESRLRTERDNLKKFLG